MSMPTVTLIAAMTRDRVIGRTDGGIPWDLPRDRDHFRHYTAGKWVLVGRRTYAEMGGWFRDRTPVILSRDPGLVPDRPWHRVARSVPGAIALAEGSGARELVVIGGAEVYAAALPHADRLVLTTIDAEPTLEEPVRFPAFSPDRWRLVARETWPEDERNAHAMALEIHGRVR